MNLLRFVKVQTKVKFSFAFFYNFLKIDIFAGADIKILIKIVLKEKIFVNHLRKFITRTKFSF
jgi:hypothetical protein